MEMQLIAANMNIYSIIALNNHNKAPSSQFSANWQECSFIKNECWCQTIKDERLYWQTHFIDLCWNHDEYDLLKHSLLIFTFTL